MSDCDICGRPLYQNALDKVSGWDGSNNAMPVVDGFCCHTCNSTVVLPRRFADSAMRLAKQ